jgi:ribosomal-protein-alanine N-acetyltransferase
MALALRRLETARLTLRPWDARDVDALHAIWTDADVRRWLWDDVVISRERAKGTVMDCIGSAEESGIGMWCVVLRGHEDTIGFCGFRFIDATTDVEIMYGFRRQYWGRGVATEAAQAVLDYGFSERLFDRVYGRTDVGNRASSRVLEKLGMRLEGQTLVGDLPTLCYSLNRAKSPG